MNGISRLLPVETPDPVERAFFDDPKAAVDRLIEVYDGAAQYLLDRFLAALEAKGITNAAELDAQQARTDRASPAIGAAMVARACWSHSGCSWRS